MTRYNLSSTDRDSFRITEPDAPGFALQRNLGRRTDEQLAELSLESAEFFLRPTTLTLDYDKLLI